MSFKFRRDGAVFPTEVKDGELIIHIGSGLIREKFKFLKEDYELDNTEFPMCNVMVFLKNENGYLIMRFDGTVTVFNNDMEVIGFTKFDKDVLYSHTSILFTGIVGHERDKKIVRNTWYYIYFLHDSDVYILECIGDAEPFQFIPNENALFIKDVLEGSVYTPILKKVGNNSYGEVTGKYIVIGTPMHTTGYINM